MSRPPAVYAALSRLLFLLEPERGHALGLNALRFVSRRGELESRLRRHLAPADPRLAQNLWGREFPSPVGLAAGFDKDGVAIPALAMLGFGFGELGTVTPRPQAGNPRPRLFRHPAQHSLQNAMGFNNAGGKALRRRLSEIYPFTLPLGVNVGKNRDTPAPRTVEDYALLVDTFAQLCDYFVVNLSSPNTPGLRDLQNERFLGELFAELRGLTRRPLLVKISPDLEDAQALAISVRAVELGAAGVVVANTTTDYGLLRGCRPAGGLSGAVLTARSRQLLAALAPELFGHAVLISVGGIGSGAEVYRRLRAGASLVEIYTALVYHGPTLVRDIHRELLELLERDGVANVGELIGVDLGLSGRRAGLP